MALTLSLVASCGLPRGGPSRSEIFAGSVTRQGNAFVVPVDSRINRAAALPEEPGFSAAFRNAAEIGSDTIRPGDVLSLTIYENVDDGLLVPEGAPSSSLDAVQVDASGFIFVPYAGRIRAAGNTPEAIRRIISQKLASQTPDPQVLVRRAAGDGATVSVLGTVGAQGIYPIERPTRTLAAMLARAGGLSVPQDVARVTLAREGRKETVWFDEIYAADGTDIALRNGDRILVEQDNRYFTALGATGSQEFVPFDRHTISAVEALAMVSGLSSAFADPKGVFVFRTEPPAIANQVLGRIDITTPQRIVYVLDLTAPNGLFEARDFEIRDGDLIYVTEAPYVQFRKIVGALTGTTGAAATLGATAGGT